jgi:multidrug resistance efflux pump
MAFSASDLTMADRRLARARDCVERQRELIQRLAASRQDTSSAEAAFRAMRRTLESFEEDRRVIEDEMFAARVHRN